MLLLIVVLIVLSVMFGGFQKGTKSGGLAPLATTSISASAASLTLVAAPRSNDNDGASMLL